MSVQIEGDHLPAGLLRRLGAIVSDSLVVVGLLILTTLLVWVPVLDVLHKKAMVPSEVGWPLTLLYWLVMSAVWGGYFVLLWSRSGQTVGMRAWRLQVVDLENRTIDRTAALKRLFFAVLPWIPAYLLFSLASTMGVEALKWLGFLALGLGIFSLATLVWRPDKQSWHDLMAQQKVILLSKL